MPSPLDKYRDLVDQFDDEQIAGMTAGAFTAADVAAWRASLTDPDALPSMKASEAREHIAGLDDPDEVSRWLADPRSTVVEAARKRLAVLPVAPAAPDDSEPTSEAPAPVEAPKAVRVVAGGVTYIHGPDGRPVTLTFRGVYGARSNPPASFLWERHRDIVEPWP